MRELSNTVATKEYVRNTLGNRFTFNNFFAWENFYIDFPLFNKPLKHQGQVCTFVMTATCFFISKCCSKIIIKMHHLELSHFCEVFTFVVNLSNTCRCLMMLKSSQCERYLLNFVV